MPEKRLSSFSRTSIHWLQKYQSSHATPRSKHCLGPTAMKYNPRSAKQFTIVLIYIDSNLLPRLKAARALSTVTSRFRALSPSPDPTRQCNSVIRKTLNTESAYIVEYDKACQYLGVDPERPEFSPDIKNFLMRFWQLPGAEWSVRQKQDPLGGGIIGDSCGLGKTRQMIIILYVRVKQM